MHRSLLAASGIAAALLLLVGGIVVSGALGPKARTIPESTTTAIATPIDRYASADMPQLASGERGAAETYLVDADGHLAPTPRGLRQETWDLMRTIMTPAVAAQMIGTFVVAYAPGSDRTAWVVERGTRDDKWVLGVNFATVTTRTQAAATLIHEYAHLLSLRDGQVVPGGDHCVTVQLPEGCARPGSYLSAFYADFWAQYGDLAPGTANADLAGALALYRTRPDAFVSEYAAMNLAEDFAESFAAYVHTDTPTAAYDGKLAFFDHYEEMVAIRDRIRADLDGVLGTFAAR